MIKCEDCAKEFKTKQGLIGHMRFVHGIKTSKQPSLFPSKRFITDDQLVEQYGQFAQALSLIEKELTKLDERYDQLFKNLKGIMEVLVGLGKFRDEQIKLNKAHEEVLIKLNERTLSQQ